MKSYTAAGGSGLLPTEFRIASSTATKASGLAACVVEAWLLEVCVLGVAAPHVGSGSCPFVQQAIDSVQGWAVVNCGNIDCFTRNQRLLSGAA